MTKPALEDIARIGSWITSQASREEAERWLARLVDAHATLATFPERCARAPERKSTKLAIRHLMIGVHRALFVVTGRVVFVLSVRHASRRPATKHDLAPALDELDES